MAHKFIQLYDKSGVKTYPVKGPSSVVRCESSSTAYWFKFATLIVSKNYCDASVVFQVNKTYSVYGYGLLYLHLRTSDTEALSGVNLTWVAHTNNMKPANWAVNYNGRTADLYVKKASASEDFHIEVMSGESRVNATYSLEYTLNCFNYTDVAGSTALPTTGTTVYSVSSRYNVGDILVSTSSTNPSTYYGGTWSNITNRVLIGAGSTYSAGGTGGASSVTLATGNLPSHSHTGPSHTHSFGATTGEGGWHEHWCESHNMATGGWETVRPNGYSGGNGSRTIAGAGTHTHWVSGTTGAAGTGSTGATGSGTAFSILPPYYGAYFWRRTA